MTTSPPRELDFANPLAEVAGVRITRDLRTALELVAAGAATHADRVQDLLQGVTDRLAALRTAREATATPAQPMALLKTAELAPVGPQPVTEFLLIPFGEVAVERPIVGGDFVFTRQHAESAKRWFDQLGRKLAIDYEHQTFSRCNTRDDGLRPAAGWIGGLDVRADGLWATDVTWTDRARELLSTGEYRYFSPVIFWTDEDQTDVTALGPVALTNDPALHNVPALAAGRATDGVEDDDPLSAARAEIDVLRRQLAGQEADAFVERGMRAGKILDSTSLDWRDDYLRDAEVAEARLSRAPILLPQGRVAAGVTKSETTHSQTLGPAPWGVEDADVAAFERACAAGRVRTVAN